MYVEKLSAQLRLPNQHTRSVVKKPVQTFKKNPKKSCARNIHKLLVQIFIAFLSFPIVFVIFRLLDSLVLLASRVFAQAELFIADYVEEIGDGRFLPERFGHIVDSGASATARGAGAVDFDQVRVLLLQIDHEIHVARAGHISLHNHGDVAFREHFHQLTVIVFQFQIRAATDDHALQSLRQFLVVANLDFLQLQILRYIDHLNLLDTFDGVHIERFDRQAVHLEHVILQLDAGQETVFDLLYRIVGDVQLGELSLLREHIAFDGFDFVLADVQGG